MKKLIVSIIFIFIALSLASVVHASKVALVVKDTASLDEEHEKRIKDVLTEMNHEITLVDKYVNVNYTDFDLIVIAGRPLFSTGKLLDSFVANIPVNDIPTIGIDFVYLDDWGWVKTSGVSSLTRSDRQNVIIQANHPLTKGFQMEEKVFVHLIQGPATVDIIKGRTKLEIVATADSDGDLGLFAYASPNTQLYGNKSVSNQSAIVFFGVTYPLYWTSDAVTLFKNSVNWLTNDTDQDGIKDYLDNCYSLSNPDQDDIDQDGIGDACDTEDNRPDLVVNSIDLPSERIECDDLQVGVIIKNIGFGNATRYDVELKVDEAVYNSSVTSSLAIDQTNKVSFTISGQDICGDVKKTLIATVKDSQPSELNNSNNQLTEILTFTTLKMDVDDDGILESAKDQNKNMLDGYEIYLDQNNNTNSFIIMGDSDNKTDYLIDIGKDGIYEKYWDPDDGILVNITYNGTDEILIDLNDNNMTDMVYYTSNNTIEYLDKNLPSVGEVTITPSYDGKTWVEFDISADVSDLESGINENSCEYTLDGTNWQEAEFSNSRCYENSLTSSLGSNLSINIRVKDRVGNLGLGTVVTRTVGIRPLKIIINLDKSSYSPDSTAYVFGEVSYGDNGEKISNAAVDYSISNTEISGDTTTDVDGRYSFSFKIPSSYGTYVLTIEASHTFAEGSNSINVNVPSPPPQSPSSSTTQGTQAIAIMRIEIPSDVTAYAGSDFEFSITVKNDGTLTLHDVDVSTNFTQFPIDITPENIILFPGKSQTFKATLIIPEDITGDYTLTFTASSYETIASKKLSLSILQKKSPLLTATGLDIPDFYFNETAEVGITIKNIGDDEAEANVSINLPPDWKIEENYKTFLIEPNKTISVYFEVIPSNELGEIEFITSYMSEGELISFTNSIEVTVIEKPEEQPQSTSTTGMIVAFLSDPKIALMTTLGTIAVCLMGIVFWRKTPFIFKSFSRSSKLSYPRKKGILPSYEKWETRYRRKNH